jgi:hypothetical protein
VFGADNKEVIDRNGVEGRLAPRGTTDGSDMVVGKELVLISVLLLCIIIDGVISCDTVWNSVGVMGKRWRTGLKSTFGGDA